MMSILLLLACFGLMMVFLFCFGRMVRKERRGRDPISPNEKMLRHAGEGLREQIDAKRDDLLDEVLDGMLVPVVVALIPGFIAFLFRSSPVFPWLLVAVALGFAVSFGYRLKRVSVVLQELRNLKLGMKGERLVGSQLEAMAVDGYYVYHDAQAQGARGKFNIDHVVVGPSGVYAVETKTRRKLDGKDGHRVGYNGTELLWPGHSETDSVQQAGNAAQWLRKHLTEKLGMNLAVKPVVAIPGWWIDRTASGPIAVVNHNEVKKVMLGKAELDKPTVDLIRRQLDSLCRDVEF